jgi:hypothetical protein
MSHTPAIQHEIRSETQTLLRDIRYAVNQILYLMYGTQERSERTTKYALVGLAVGLGLMAFANMSAGNALGCAAY